jgi:hypothetical protein
VIQLTFTDEEVEKIKKELMECYKNGGSPKIIFIADETEMKIIPIGEEINPITGKPYKRSPEFRAKASARNKGKKLSEETKQKISDSMKGHKVKIQTKVKLSQSLRGKSRPEEVKAKISETKQQNKNKDI